MKNLTFLDPLNLKTFKENSDNLINLYLSQKDISEESKIIYSHYLKKFFYFLNNLEDLNQKTIIDFKESLNNLSATSIKDHIYTLRSFFLWLDNQIKNPYFISLMNDVRLPYTSKNYKKDPLTVDQIANLLNDIETTSEIGKRDYAIILLMVTSGLRPIEISNLNVSDIGNLLNENILYIKGKGHHDKDGIVKIGEKTDLAIREYLSSRSDIVTPESPLFISTSNFHKGNRLTAKGISKIIRNYLRKNGFPSGGRISPYSLRHSCAMIALLNSKKNKGNILLDIQQVLRHKSIESSMYYLQPLDRLENNIELMIDDIIGEKLI